MSEQLTPGAPTATGTYFAVIKCYVSDEPQMCVLHFQAHKALYRAVGHAFNVEVKAEDVVGYVGERERHDRKNSVDEEWKLFWKPIVCKEDGTINIEQVKKELHAFSYLMEQIPKVYCHITGSRMSKVFYPAETVISVSDDYQQEVIEQAVKDELGEREAAVAGREEYAVEFAEWTIREGWTTSHDRKGWMKHSDETPYVLTTAQLYELFKQQKEK